MINDVDDKCVLCLMSGTEGSDICEDLSVPRGKLCYWNKFDICNYNNNNDRLTAFDPGQPG